MRLFDIMRKLNFCYWALGLLLPPFLWVGCADETSKPKATTPVKTQPETETEALNQPDTEENIFYSQVMEDTATNWLDDPIAPEPPKPKIQGTIGQPKDKSTFNTGDSASTELDEKLIRNITEFFKMKPKTGDINDMLVNDDQLELYFKDTELRIKDFPIEILYQMMMFQKYLD